MRYFTPAYYREFRCSAADCPDSCCRAGWGIPVDDDTYDFYRTFDVGIEENTYIDSDGDRVFKLKPDKSCVYFNSQGLCELYIKTGRQCEICDKYPRFFEEYDGFGESGLSLSCPTAAKLILTQRENPYGEIERSTDDRLLSFLIEGRRRAMDMIYSEDPDAAAAKLFGYGFALQELIDFDDLGEIEHVVPQEDRYMFSEETQIELRDYILNRTEILNESWRKQLREKPEPAPRGTETERRNYLAYLCSRYFLKAINSEDIAAACGFITALYVLTARLKGDFTENVRTVCKEIEHDADNISIMMEFLS